MLTTTPDLKPCLYCKPEDFFNGPKLETHDVSGLQTAFHFVECDDCGATGPRCATKREAINAWNQRATLTQPTDPFAWADGVSWHKPAHRAVMASVKLGGWMSAALDDPKVCDAMKADIREWFSAGEPMEILCQALSQPTEPNDGREAQPVAWMYMIGTWRKTRVHLTRHFTEYPNSEGWTEIPLYASPPPEAQPGAVREDDEGFDDRGFWLGESIAAIEAMEDEMYANEATPAPVEPTATPLENNEWIKQAQGTLDHLGAALQRLDVPHRVDWREWIDQLVTKFAPIEPSEAEARSCTCHPDDRPAGPCKQRYANSECVEAEAREVRQTGLPEWAEYCAPGDRQEDIWLIRFDDSDMRDLIWTGSYAEKDARAAFASRSTTWNCYLFRLAFASTRPSTKGDRDDVSRTAAAVIPTVRGVGRMIDNEKALLVMLDRKPTDDELRVIHDHLASTRPAAAVEPNTYQVIGKRMLNLASYCGGEGDCTDKRPCNDCLAMDNVALVTGEIKVLGGLDYCAELAAKGGA